MAVPTVCSHLAGRKASLQVGDVALQVDERLLVLLEPAGVVLARPAVPHHQLHHSLSNTILFVKILSL